ncbi:MAG: Na(+)-translocating NADH-quinone reductase subunit C [Bacteroidetes bacterium ADurb.Bin408]|nr:MAG: Na(+)-translocating NADH-quinone reductase subunit C [Bacteroidetes bacterium ADurb.Bin408]
MHSNRYIFIYSVVMVVVVAITLSIVVLILKPFQEANIRTEKIQNILTSINIQSNKKESQDMYKKYIKEELLIKNDGTYRQGSAFDVKLKDELKKDISKREMPLFIAETDDGKRHYIVPLWGRGLWGAIWGYISFNDDLNTVFGALFDHKSETPGLGAEISTRAFQEQFINKKIFDDNGNFVSVHVIKGGAPKGDIHGVDAISGGTITSNGVNMMLKENVGFYVNYFKTLKNTNNHE